MRKRVLTNLEGVGPSQVFLPDGAYAFVLDFLEVRFPRGTRAGWEARMQAGRVFDQFGNPLGPESKYTPRTMVYYYREVVSESPIPFQEEIIYEDEAIVVADKPHFLAVTPIGPYIQETLLVRLRNRLQQPDLSAVHRLDLETAGIVLFTKIPSLRDAYSKLFREQQIHKTYHAIAKFDSRFIDELVYESRIEPAERFMQMREVSGLPNTKTKIQLQEWNQELGLYRLQPSTGKKHQLRVHMNALGIPILNDQIYPELKTYVEPSKRNFDAPLQLLAKSLEFCDPFSGKRHFFESKRPLNWIKP